MMSLKWCAIGCKLVLFTNRKLHTGDGDLNDLEPHNGIILSHVTQSCSFWNQLC